ncbi:hypothetical protein [Nocardioides sp. GXQ0305]|uniref:hypothetical protein n=1 Tax=Nocardioides sp. GXQ0305 TaxID=3423912 RepID=UPI003D7CDEED
MTSGTDQSPPGGRNVGPRLRTNELPRLVTVDLGNRVAEATALAVRAGAQGHQTLVIADGTLAWLASHRVVTRVATEDSPSDDDPSRTRAPQE